jgi:hypothetical protein
MGGPGPLLWWLGSAEPPEEPEVKAAREIVPEGERGVSKQHED